MTTHSDVVSLEAIPLDRSEECFNRLGPYRRINRKLIDNAYQMFKEDEEAYAPMHLKTQENAKESLKTLMAACNNYADNLGWKL